MFFAQSVDDGTLSIDPSARVRVRARRQDTDQDEPRTKTSTGRRELPISVEAARWARANLPKPPEGPVFRTRTGARLSDRNVRRALDGVTEPLRLVVGDATCLPPYVRVPAPQRRALDSTGGWLGQADAAFTLRTYVHLMDDGLGGALGGSGWVTH